MTDSTYFIEGDEGQPLGIVNMDVISDAGWQFAIRTAAHCDDVVVMDAIAADTLTEVGVESFPYVAASGFRYLAQEILSPALTAGEAAGVHLRDGLLALSKGENPAIEFADEPQEPQSRADIARAVLAAIPDELPDDFESLRTWTVPEVYDRRTDRFSDVEIEAGWTPGGGPTVKVDNHEYTKAEALELAAALWASVTWLNGYFVEQSDDRGPDVA